MRFIFIQEETSLKTLGAKLFRAGREDAPGAVERLKAANPHVDLSQLRAGTVLVVPDAPDFKTDEDAVGATTFGDFAAEAVNAVKAGSARVQSGLVRDERAREQVDEVMDSSTVKALASKDEELQARIDAARARAKADEKDGKDVPARLTQLQEGLAKELEKLQAFTR